MRRNANVFWQVRTPSLGGHGHIPTWIPGKGDVIGLTHREVSDVVLISSKDRSARFISTFAVDKRHYLFTR